MIAAIFTAIIAVLLAYYSGFEKKHYYRLILAFVLLTIFLSLGYYWGNDVESYEKRFSYYTTSGISPFNIGEYDYVARSEFGFVFINMLCKPLGFWGMRALLFTIENAIILYFIIKHVDKKWYWLAVFVYVFNPNFWVLSSSMMRQWLAICLCLLGADFLSRNKLRWFVVLVLLASTIHQTAIVCFLLLPLYYLSKNYSTGMLFAFIVGLLLFFLFSSYFRDYIVLWINMEDVYTSYSNVTTDIGITAVGRMALFILLLYIAIKQKYREVFFYWVVMLYAITLPLLSYSQLVSRIGLYFTISTIVVYPSFMSSAKIEKTYKIVFVLIICSYLLYSFYLFFTGNTYSRYYYNYQILPFLNL